jgi:hypothetical protein
LAKSFFSVKIIILLISLSLALFLSFSLANCSNAPRAVKIVCTNRQLYCGCRLTLEQEKTDRKSVSLMRPSFFSPSSRTGFSPKATLHFFLSQGRRRRNESSGRERFLNEKRKVSADKSAPAFYGQRLYSLFHQNRGTKIREQSHAG